MAEETRQKILEAVEKLILLRGLSRVTTREIARETGLSEGALYRHFKQKDEIFFAIMRKHLPTLLAAFQTHQPGTGTISENLAAIAVALIHYYEQLLPLSASYLADTELLERYREAIRPLNAGPQHLLTRVASYIEEEQRLGRLGKRVAPETIATLLLGPCFQRAFIVQLLDYDPLNKTDQQFAEELAQGLLTGILPV